MHKQKWFTTNLSQVMCNSSAFYLAAFPVFVFFLFYFVFFTWWRFCNIYLAAHAALQWACPGLLWYHMMQLQYEDTPLLSSQGEFVSPHILRLHRRMNHSNSANQIKQEGLVKAHAAHTLKKIIPLRNQRKIRNQQRYCTSQAGLKKITAPKGNLGWHKQVYGDLAQVCYVRRTDVIESWAIWRSALTQFGLKKVAIKAAFKLNSANACWQMLKLALCNNRRGAMAPSWNPLCD